MGSVWPCMLLAVGCGRVGFDRVATADAESAMPDAFVRCTFGPFSPTLQHVPTLNSTAFDWGPSVSADDLTLYFSSNRGGDEDLYRATRATAADGWTTAAPIAELAAPGSEEGNPSISTDELTLYWGQNKLWRARRETRTDPWGAPELLLDETVGRTQLQGPEISFDDLSLYFTADLATGDRDLFVMTRPDPASPFDEPVNLSSLNSLQEDAWPAIARDDLELFFVSGRSGVSMMYVASRAERTAAWGMPVALRPGETSEFDPEVSSDLTTLWFAKQGPGSLGSHDLYTVTRACQ